MKRLRYTRPIYIENSRLPSLLSYISPITIAAITIGPLVFSSGVLDDTVKRHEAIHWQQYIDTCIIGFPVLYVLFWMLALIKYRDRRVAYLMIPFEQEAYCKEQQEFYLLTRKRYAWCRYRI